MMYIIIAVGLVILLLLAVLLRRSRKPETPQPAQPAATGKQPMDEKTMTEHDTFGA